MSPLRMTRHPSSRRLGAAFLVVSWLSGLIVPLAWAGACAYQGFRSSPRVGGVSLDVTAKFLGDLTTVTGAYFDDRTGQIVLTGTQNAALPKMNQDDLAACIRVIYRNRLPEVSIDPPPGGSGQGFLNVRIPAEIDDTHFGWVLFEADRILKAYSLGKDNISGQAVVSRVPGYKSILERWKEKEQAGSTGDGDGAIRFWFVPKTVKLKKTAAGTEFLFEEVAIELLTETLSGNPDPEVAKASADFVAHFNANYLEFAKEQPVLMELLELAKITGVVRWLRDNNIPMDLTWVETYKLAFKDVPARTPEIEVKTSFDKGNTTITLRILGGVLFAKPNAYTLDEATVASLRAAAKAGRPDELTFGWKFDNNQKLASSHSLTPFIREGSFTQRQTDVAIPARGAFDLTFQRFYSSFNPAPGPLGFGWDHAPSKLHFPVPTDTVEGTFKDVKAIFQRRVIVVDRLAGKQVEYVVVNDKDWPTNYFPQDPVALAQTFHRNADNTYTLTQRDQSQQTFDLAGRLLKQVDRSGNALTYTYDANGRLTEIADPANRKLTLSYDGSGRITKLATPDPEIAVTYTYDANGDLVKSSGLACASCTTEVRYTYNAAHQITKVEDRESRILAESTYDVYGRTASQKDSGGRTWTALYSLDKRLAVDSDGTRVTIRAFDAKYRPVQVVDPAGLSTTFAYVVSSDEPATIRDPRSVVTQFGFDRWGNRIVTRFPDPFKWEILTFYNAKHLPIESWDGRYASSGAKNGIKVSLFQYDAKGNLTRREEAYTQNVTTFEYDAFGQLIKETDPNGNITKYEYGTAGDLTKVTDAEGRITTHEYDALSRRTKTTDPASHVTTFKYDPAGRLLETTQTIKDAAGNDVKLTTTFGYDSQGNLIERIDPAGRKTTYAYNAKSLLTTVTDAAIQTTTYDYDVYGNKLTMTDAKGRTTRYTYDALNRLTKVILPSGPATAYTYDPNGNRTSRTTPDGLKTTYTYDELNRLTKLAYPDGTSPTRTYDERGNVSKTDDGSGTATYAYDLLDRLTSYKDQHGQQVAYGYLFPDLLTILDAPDGTRLGYTYTKANLLEACWRWDAANQKWVRLVVWLYHPDATLLAIYREAPGNLVTRYTYDAAHRLVDLEHFDNDDLKYRSRSLYTYDRAGNRTSEQSLRARLLRTATTDTTFYTFRYETASYAYDALDRLTQVTFPEGTKATYAYDAVGNRTQETTPQGATITSTYDADDRLLETSDSRRFAYDKRGNLAVEFRGGQLFRSYTYDPDDRLTQVTTNPDPFGQPTETWRFTYDTLGRRTTTNRNGFLERHTYHLAGPLPVLLQTQEPTTRQLFIHGGATLLAEGGSAPATWQYPLADPLGSTTELVNAKGELASVLHYDPWGKVTDTLDPSRLSGFPVPTAPIPPTLTHRFTGEPQLSGLDLVYLRARWYDPTLGRFLTRDPLIQQDAAADQLRRRLRDVEPQTFFRDDRNPQGLHPYTYVQNNPLRYVDPLGLAVGDWWDLPANFGRAREISREERQARPVGHNNAEDAMRHAEWSRRMVQEINVFTAWVAGVGHEIDNLLRGQPRNETIMDLHNNAVGRSAGAQGRPVNPGDLRTSPDTGSRYNPYARGCQR